MGTVKVKEINLEYGNPTVEVALRNMVNQLSTAKGGGYKAVILVHGYGSSGVGGAIKKAVRLKLKERSLCGVVRDFVGGEDWANQKKNFCDQCNQLKEFSSYVKGNQGLTVVTLR